MRASKAMAPAGPVSVSVSIDSIGTACHRRETVEHHAETRCVGESDGSSAGSAASSDYELGEQRSYSRPGSPARRARSNAWA